MNKEYMREWIRRLRSGDYKQCKEELRNTTLEEFEYCCLGIAELQASEHVEGTRIDGCMPSQACDAYFGSPLEEMELQIPPKHMTDKIQHHLKSYLNRHEEDEDAPIFPYELNDMFDFTFDQIADCIEFTLANSPAKLAQ